MIYYINFSLYFFYFLFSYFHLLYTSYKQYLYDLGDNSLCKSMIGSTYYSTHSYLCNLPCFIQPQFTIPNRTYGTCNNNSYITYIRSGNYIEFNENGYIYFLNFNNRIDFIENTQRIIVYFM